MFTTVLGIGVEDAMSKLPVPVSLVELLGATATVGAALDIRLRSTEQIRRFLDHFTALARPQPMELELAMLIAWIRRRDPIELGYSSASAFYAERIDWGASWRKALVRLVESELDEVKRAALERSIPLRVAVRAPGRIGVQDQAEWIEAQRGTAPAEQWLAERELAVERGRSRWAFDWHHGEEAEQIRRARREARACLGRAATAREVDEYIVACHRNDTPPERILARAHERPAVPEPVGPLSWAWSVWEEPRDVADALDRIERLQAVLRGRTAVLARAWVLVLDEALWVAADCETAEEFANEFLGISLRQAQRLARLGRALGWYPELDAAVREGLSPRAAAAVATVADERTMGRWLAIAARVGRKELARAVQEARETSERRTLASYERAIALADGWATNAATGSSETEVSAPDPHRATSAGPPPVRVALPPVEVPAREALVGAPAAVREASRWWCEKVRLPPKRGFSAVKERDHYRCQNPDCGRASLRNEAHHVVWRSRGGDDSDGNAVTVCRPCHLRGIHAGWLRVERVDAAGVPALLWTWPDGRRALLFRERT